MYTRHPDLELLHALLELRRPERLTAPRLAILHALARAPKRLMLQRDLASAMKLSVSCVADHVGILEFDGLVSLGRAGRHRTLTLTVAGQRAVERSGRPPAPPSPGPRVVSRMLH